MLGTEPIERPLVGVGVFVYNTNHELLLGKRKGSHGAGEWGLPGGHLEFNESFEECCIREVKEETNLDIRIVRKLGFTNNIFESDGVHYVTLFFKSNLEGASWSDRNRLKLMEPQKCEEWKWFSLDSLPSPLFSPLAQILRDTSSIYLNKL